jgi:hypothetical protein
MASTVPLGSPLVRASSGQSVLFTTLGAMFHLETLIPGDEDQLIEVHRLLDAWFGDELRWSLCSAVERIERFVPSDFEFVTSYPSLLEVRGGYPNDPALHSLYSNLASIAVTQFGLVCKGGNPDDDSEASPYTYNFFSVIAAKPADPFLHTRAMLRFTVPIAWPLADFYARVLAVAAGLRLRWGAAGLMYSGWDIGWSAEVADGIYAHARRYSGYDTGYHVTHMADWHERLRTVSWLTFLGPEFVTRLAALGHKLESPDRSVEVISVGPNTMIRAGAQPDAGDLNRSRLPPPYVIADAMVRPLRAGSDKSFYGRWTETTTVKWLKRFEKRLA